MSDENNTIVLDNGSGYIKAGITGNDAPSAVFPNMIGRPKFESGMVQVEQKEFLIGDEADRKRGILKLTYPVESGIIKEWDDMEKIWTHCFTNELRVDTSESKVLITEAPMNPKQNKEKMCSMAFETFEFQAF